MNNDTAPFLRNRVLDLARATDLPASSIRVLFATNNAGQRGRLRQLEQMPKATRATAICGCETPARSSEPKRAGANNVQGVHNLLHPASGRLYGLKISADTRQMR